MGRKAQPRIISHGAPLIRVKLKDLAAAGVEQVPRTVGIEDGRPALEDGRILDVSNVIWCTGFRWNSPGSTSPSSVRTDVPCTSAASWLESLACTSWDCSSSTQRRPMFSPASGETRSTLRSTLRRACRTVGPWDTRRLEHAAIRCLIPYGPEPLLMLTAFEVLDAEE